MSNDGKSVTVSLIMYIIPHGQRQYKFLQWKIPFSCLQTYYPEDVCNVVWVVKLVVGIEVTFSITRVMLQPWMLTGSLCGSEGYTMVPMTSQIETPLPIRKLSTALWKERKWQNETRGWQSHINVRILNKFASTPCDMKPIVGCNIIIYKLQICPRT